MLTFPDIHTHHAAPLSGFSIISSSPEHFVPQERHHYSVGFHPWALSAEYPSETDWKHLSRLVCLPQVLAVGEAGLDKLAAVPLPLQETVFERQARLADEMGKPLVIHLVKAVDELLQAALMAIPLSRLFLETDESSLPITDIYARVARIRRIPLEDLSEAVCANVQSVFLP